MIFVNQMQWTVLLNSSNVRLFLYFVCPLYNTVRAALHDSAALIESPNF